MNRLTNEDRNGTGERYAYDLCGNRLLKEQYSGSSVDAAEGYRYNERNELTERIKAGSFTVYSYDKNGSIISEEEEGRKSEYRYDLLNRQIYVKTLEGKEQENSYDGDGLRAGLTENGKKTTFLYHNGEILTEFDGESAPIKRYLRGIGLSHVQTQDSEAYHAYHQDEQGSTAFITGQGRETENIYQYDAFGNLLEKREDVGNRILYTAQQYDQETGQYYLRARYYNPEVGRFLQEDTYRGDGLNLYAYCANNPVVYYDPSGHAMNYENTGENAQKNPSSDLGNYIFKDGVDKDLRGGQGTYKDALEEAFENTGIPKEDFTVTKWGRDKNGKSFPVEWRADNGAEVNIDLGHSPQGDAPTVPHIGWQTGGKRGTGGAKRGHIFVDDVPYNR